MSLLRRFGRGGLVCRDAVELVTDYLDGALSPGDRRRFEEHLALCPHCAEYLRQIQVSITLTGRVDPERLDPAAMDALTELYRNWRQERDG